MGDSPAADMHQDYSDDLHSSTEADSIESPAGSELERGQREVYDLLSAEPSHVDQLCLSASVPIAELSARLVMLELGGYALRLPGDFYVRASCARQAVDSRDEVSVTATPSSDVRRIIGFIRQYFGGVSRKYLQFYLAQYWYQTVLVKSAKHPLIEECLQFAVVSYKEILDYISPLIVRVPLPTSIPEDG